MQGPHFDFLTNSYVEALGLEKFVYEHSEPVVAFFISEGAMKPLAMRGFAEAVAYNHGLYLREADGLAWSRRT